MAKRGETPTEQPEQEKIIRWVSPERKRRFNQPPCMMCAVYQKAPDKPKAHGVKYCYRVDKFVFGQDFCIKNFEPAVYFECPEYNYKINTAVCLHRRTPKCDYGGYYDICKKCYFGVSLYYYETLMELEYIFKGE